MNAEESKLKFGNDKVCAVEEAGKAVHWSKEWEPLDPHAVRIEVIYCGICGADIHIFKGKHPSCKLPATLGHECCGRIVELGSEVTGLEIGQRVAVEPVVYCGTCKECLSGHYSYCSEFTLPYRKGKGFMTKYVTMHDRFVYPVPDEIPDEVAAMTEPISIAVRAIKRAHVEMGSNVLITGGGPIAQLCVAIAAQLGARNVVTVARNPSQLQMSKDLGATHTIDTREYPDWVAKSKEICPKGFDCILECIGVACYVRGCMDAACKGATVVQVGLFEEPELELFGPIMVSKELSYVGSASCCWDFDAALAIARKVDLSCIATHKFPMSDIQGAFDVITDRKKSGAIKVLCWPDW